ncbi:unnamed protein product [Gadus morhua 'NCC']
MVKPQSQHSGGRGVEQAGCSYAGDGEASWTAPAPGVISSLAGQQPSPGQRNRDDLTRLARVSFADGEIKMVILIKGGFESILKHMDLVILVKAPQLKI